MGNEFVMHLSAKGEDDDLAVLQRDILKHSKTMPRGQHRHRERGG